MNIRSVQLLFFLLLFHFVLICQHLFCMCPEIYLSLIFNTFLQKMSLFVCNYFSFYIMKRYISTSSQNTVPSIFLLFFLITIIFCFTCRRSTMSRCKTNIFSRTLDKSRCPTLIINLVIQR